MYDGLITITKTNSLEKSGAERNYISINIKDATSRVNILDIKMDLEKFALAVTGFSYQPVLYDIDKDKAQYLGHKKIIESRSILYTGDGNNEKN